MALPARLDELLGDLDRLADRSERIDALIGIANRFRDVPQRVAERPFGEEHKVPACESQAYVFAEPRRDGTLDFHFAVENPQGISAKAMAVILGETVSGAPLEEIAELPGDIVYRIFGRELSMGKSMGLMTMVGMVTGMARKVAGGRGA